MKNPLLHRHRFPLIIFWFACLWCCTVSLQAAGAFEETFESYKPGESLSLQADGRFTEPGGTDEATVQKATDGGINSTNVLQHKSTAQPVITRTKADVVEPLSSGVFSLDVKPTSGEHGIYLWEGGEDTKKQAGRIIVWFREDGRLTCTMQDSQSRFLGKALWQAGNWYRVRITFAAEPGAPAICGVEIRDLTENVTLVQVEGIPSEGFPEHFAGAQIFSSSASGEVLAEFDNWQIKTSEQ